MALQQIQIAPEPQQYRTTKGKQGGGKMGQKIGTVAGGVIGGLAGTAGGPAGIAAGAMGGAAAGGSLGSSVGEMVKPTQQGRQEAVGRRLDGQMQTQQLQTSDRTHQLRSSLASLRSQPEPVRREFSPPLIEAYTQSLALDKKGVA